MLLILDSTATSGHDRPWKATGSSIGNLIGHEGDDPYGDHDGGYDNDGNGDGNNDGDDGDGDDESENKVNVKLKTILIMTMGMTTRCDAGW